MVCPSLAQADIVYMVNTNAGNRSAHVDLTDTNQEAISFLAIYITMYILYDRALQVNLVTSSCGY